MSAERYQVSSLQALSFRVAIDNAIPLTNKNSIPASVREYLWRQLFEAAPPSTHCLYRYLKETANLKAVLQCLFRWKTFDMWEHYEEYNAINQLYELISLDLTNLSKVQTLKFVIIYLFLNSIERLCMPERFAVFWCRDKKLQCKWCAEDAVYVAAENKHYFTDCCGKLKISYHVFYEPDNFNAIVTDINSYCSACLLPLYTIKDVESYNFPSSMYFCTLCD
ncbi:ORF-104 [Agrotis segetum nucleopolyhedrovirus A]|uniref:ORF-104 n=1 Tax=Agrotis segetum nuclear polyhedrosis virus TaxID=1962501 RepID=Q287G8_NPVAS|nr:ORF-104 [Agrotis segetum nucleopolyhedrovirus A]AAZ38270.1 ORF-104 [Agrotis segetum nucleopolyhedrovirus A]